MFHMSKEAVPVVLEVRVSVASDDDCWLTISVVAVHHDPVVAGWSQLQKMAVNVPVGGIRIGGTREQMRQLSSVEVLLLPERMPTPLRQHHLLQTSQAVIDVGELATRGHDHLPWQLVILVHELDRLSVAHTPRVQVYVLVVESLLHSSRSTRGGCNTTIAGSELLIINITCFGIDPRLHVRAFFKCQKDSAHLSNCAEQARPPAAAQVAGVRELGVDQVASRRGRPELSDRVIESGDSTDSLLPMSWVELS